MLWRNLRLNWKYAIGELVIVVLGVLIALGVDQWNTDRIERIEELAIIDRLIADLELDLEALQFELRSLDAKEESLERVARAVEDEVADPMSFLRDVIEGANFGWNQMQAQRTTFNELLSSGKFGVIRDAGLRQDVSSYYDLDESSYQRIDERETQYPGISYRLVPRINEGRIEAEFGNTLDVEPDIEASEAWRIVQEVVESELSSHITAEINFARFVRNIALRLQDRCSDVLSLLEEYRSTIA
jgi:hypothetical protein